MKAYTAIVLFIAIFLALSAAVLVTIGWNSLASKENVLAIELQEFDKKIDRQSDACFSLQIESNLNRQTITDYIVTVGDKIVKKEQIDVGQNKLIKGCVPKENMASEENTVEIMVRNIKVFFHVNVKDQIQKTAPELLLEQTSAKKIKISVMQNTDDSHTPIEIFVNDKLDHRIYFSGEQFVSEEKIDLDDGQNKVKVKFKGIEKTLLIEQEPQFKMHLIAGITVISLLLWALFALVFFQKPFVERISFSIVSFFAIFIISAFILDITGLLSALSFTTAIILVTVVVLTLFWKNLEKSIQVNEFSPKKIVEKSSPLAILLVAVIIFSSLTYHFWTPTYFSIFTSFYERQSHLIAELQSVPTTDPFSFLGTKPFGYFSGYFFINAGISWIASTTTMQSFAIIALLSQTAFLASAILFFRSINISGKKSILGALLLLLGVFVFSDVLFNIRHVVANSFMILALYFLKKHKTTISAGLLSIAGFVQPPVFLMFVALCIVAIDWKKEAKQFAKTVVLGAIELLILFVPTFLRSGLPTQAKPEVWGYLWSIPIYGLILDFFSIFVFLAVFVIPFILLKKTSFDGFAKKTAIVLFAFMLVQLFISYRINVVNSVILAILGAHIFPNKFLENRFSEYALSALFAVVLLAMAILSITFYPLHPTGSHAFNFIKENTSTNANFMVEPYLGHPFILVAQRKASADLAVEYANEQMINDSYDYIKEKDPALLQKYNIDFIVNRSIFLDEKPIGDNLYHELIEFPDQDKIYSNDIFFIHQARKK